MLILMGKGGAGKDAVKSILIKKYGFHSLTSYTSRPKRDGEIDGENYRFISSEEFESKMADGFFAEWKSYEVGGETWYYGLSKEDIEQADEKTVTILTPSGVKDVRKLIDNSAVIYLYINNSTQKNRLKLRNDKHDDMNDRIKRDDEDFKGAELIADRIVYNDRGYDIEEVTSKVVEQYEKCMRRWGNKSNEQN